MANVRKRLAQGADDHYDLIEDTLLKVLNSDKEIWHTCEGCKHRSPVRVPDYNAMMRALQVWLDQGYGRPTEDAAAEPPAPQFTLKELQADYMRRAPKILATWTPEKRYEFARACGFLEPASA